MKAGWVGFPKGDGDFWGAMEEYAKIGYRGMEGGESLLGMGNDDESVRRFYDLGLEILTVSTSIEEIKKDIKPLVERVRVLRTNRATIWAGSVGFWRAEQPLKAEFFKEVELMEKAAEALSKEGIRLCFHNHSTEFIHCYDDIPAIDHMMANTQHLCLELDIGWANYAGVDPVAVLKKYADRIGAVHMKDYIAENTVHDPAGVAAPFPVFTSLGTGVVDVPAILKCMNEINIDWAIYEQDTIRNLSDIESMTVSYLNMKETGLVE